MDEQFKMNAVGICSDWVLLIREAKKSVAKDGHKRFKLVALLISWDVQVCVCVWKELKQAL